MIHWFNRAPGPVVVLLHGFAGTVHAWDDVSQHLPKDIAVAGIALPGHHIKAPPQANFAATRDVLLAEVRTLSPGAIHLVGYSLGARMALAMSLYAPELFFRVTLISGHVGLSDARSRRERLTSDERWMQLLEEEGLDAFVHKWNAQPLFMSQRGLSPSTRQAQDRERGKHDAHALAASLRSTGLAVMPDYWSELAGSLVPTTFVVGGDDMKFGAIAREAHKRTPSSRLVVIPQCGHNPLLESPRLLAKVISALEVI